MTKIKNFNPIPLFYSYITFCEILVSMRQGSLHLRNKRDTLHSPRNITESLGTFDVKCLANVSTRWLLVIPYLSYGREITPGAN